LAKNQQKKDGDRSGILTEHKPQKYLICNDISKDWGVYRASEEEFSVSGATAGEAEAYRGEKGAIKRMLKQGTGPAPNQKIVTSGIGSGLKKSVYEIEQDKFFHGCTPIFFRINFCSGDSNGSISQDRHCCGGAGVDGGEPAVQAGYFAFGGGEGLHVDR
jgi:hypothetical protein